MLILACTRYTAGHNPRRRTPTNNAKVSCSQAVKLGLHCAAQQVVPSTTHTGSLLQCLLRLHVNAYMRLAMGTRPRPSSTAQDVLHLPARHASSMDTSPHSVAAVHTRCSVPLRAVPAPCHSTSCRVLASALSAARCPDVNNTSRAFRARCTYQGCSALTLEHHSSLNHRTCRAASLPQAPNQERHRPPPEDRLHSPHPRRPRCGPRGQ